MNLRKSCSWLEVLLWSGIVCASAVLFSGCNDYTELLVSVVADDVEQVSCASQKDCKAPTTSSPDVGYAALYGIMNPPTRGEASARTPAYVSPVIRFNQAGIGAMLGFDSTGSTMYVVMAYRQPDGSYTAQGFQRTDPATTYTYFGSLANVQDIFAATSGVSTHTPASHPTLLADLPGTSSLKAVVTKLGGAAAYSLINTGSNNDISVSLDNPNTLGQSKTSYPVGTNPVGILVADFNGDGKRDVAVLNQGTSSGTGTVSILPGVGDGTLGSAVSYNTGVSPASMTSFYFGTGGRPNLAIANQGNGSDLSTQTVSILLTNNDGSMRAGQSYTIGSYGSTPPKAILAADFDGDGKTDLMVYSQDYGLTLLHGNGDGTFQVVTPQKTGYKPTHMPLFLASGDFNKDGKIDLATLNDDGTASILLNAGDGSFPTVRTYVVGTRFSSGYVAGLFGGLLGGMFAMDFNDDGNLDLVFANGHPDALFPNPGFVTVLFGKGDGTFQGAPVYDTGAWPASIASADFNGDGRPDLVGGGSEDFNLGGSAWIMLGQSGGSIHAPTALPGVTDDLSWVGVADLNADGHMDVIATRRNNLAAFTWFGNGDGTFQSPVTSTISSDSGPAFAAVGDLNGDGRPDLIVARGDPSLASGGPGSVFVMLAKAGGGFNPATTLNTGTNPTRVALADLNGDGKLDLVVANLGYTANAAPTAVAGSVSVLLGKGDGTFQAPVNYSVAQNPLSVAIADLNGDGKPDLIVGTTTGTDSKIAVLLGTGTGTFGSPTLFDTYSEVSNLQVVDLDKDGKLDLVIVHTPGDRAISIMRGNGDGTFQAEVQWLAGYSPLGAVAVDLYADNKPGLAVLDPGDLYSMGSVSFFRNLSGGGGTTNPTTTVTTNPAGLAILVDSVSLSAPQTFNWNPGDSHTIGVASPQTSAGVRYVFSSWSDSRGQTHSITAPSADTTYTASFTATQYLLTTSASPPAGGTVAANPSSSDGYYNAGTSVQLTATYVAGYQFSGWSGDLTGSANPQSITMSAPHSVTATFTGGSGTLSGLRFVPVTPCRVADTRNATGTFGGPTIPAAGTRSFPIPSSSCGIPASAQAYSLNVTVVPQGALGYLSIWPAGFTQPYVSTLNSLDGRIKANASIVPAGTNGAISVYVTDKTDVVLDINGYFTATSDSSALAFYPATPCRIADTRNASGAFGGPSLTAGGTRTFTIPQSSCGIPSNALAYSLNFTVVPKSALGYLTTWPAGGAQPYVSTLNSPLGTVVANAAIVPAGANGAVSVYATDATDVILDVNGYFAGPGAGGYLFYAVNPCRISDTRNATGTFGGPIMAANATRTYPIPQSGCGLPASATGYSLNVTVVPSGYLGYLTLWPSGVTQPYVSTLNAFDGSITANAALVPAGTSGGVSVFVLNDTHVILDVNGYFAPGSTSAPAPGTVLVSDSVNRADATGCSLGKADLALGGGGNHYYLPINSTSSVSLVSGALQNNTLDYAGVQLTASSTGCGGHGETLAQDLYLRADLLVPSSAAGVAMAGPYFRSRAAAAGDGIIGGTSSGYWVALTSTGEVRLRGLNPNAVIATTGIPASFNASVFHTLEMVAQGMALQVYLDGSPLTFTQNGSAVTSVTLPANATNASNDGTVGIAFADEDNRGKAGGQRARNLVVAQPGT